MDNVTHRNHERLVKFVTAALTQPDFVPDKVAVYMFRDSDGGIRISEISYTKRTDTGEFGGSWMASDVDCAKVLFAAERFLLFVDTPVLNVDSWDTDLDEGQEHEQRLWHALTGAFPKWQERPATHHYDGPGQYSEL